MDNDLQKIIVNADRLTVAGVRRLVGALQGYRNAARTTAYHIDRIHTETGDTASAQQLRTALDTINSMAGEAMRIIDDDTIDLEELT